MQSNTTSYFQLRNHYSHYHYPLLKPTTTCNEVFAATQYHSLQIYGHPIQAAMNALLIIVTHFSTYVPTDMHNHPLPPFPNL